MYGTVARMRVTPGRLSDVLALWDEWEMNMKPTVDGAIGASLYQLDADENTVMVAVAFRDKTSYFKNADNPEQDKWYGRMRECLAADPEWNDGEILRSG